MYNGFLQNLAYAVIVTINVFIRAIKNKNDLATRQVHM